MPEMVLAEVMSEVVRGARVGWGGLESGGEGASSGEVGGESSGESMAYYWRGEGAAAARQSSAMSREASRAAEGQAGGGQVIEMRGQKVGVGGGQLSAFRDVAVQIDRVPRVEGVEAAGAGVPSTSRKKQRRGERRDWYDGRLQESNDTTGRGAAERKSAGRHYLFLAAPASPSFRRPHHAINVRS